MPYELQAGAARPEALEGPARSTEVFSIPFSNVTPDFHPGISPEQCRRIKAIAKRLQYQPDPLVAKLMSPQPREQGRVALDLVVAQIQRNERGSPVRPQTVLLDPVWKM